MFNSANYFPKNNLIQREITNARKKQYLVLQSPEHFLWSVDRGVATITLNRPERKNPLTFESYAEMRDRFRDLVYSEEVKGVVITVLEKTFVLLRFKN